MVASLAASGIGQFASYQLCGSGSSAAAYVSSTVNSPDAGVGGLCETTVFDALAKFHPRIDPAMKLSDAVALVTGSVVFPHSVFCAVITCRPAPIG